MSGTITDPQGAAVPGAAILLLNTSTAAQFQTVSSASGEYVLPSLPNATYRMTVTAAGFRTGVLNQVKVDAGVDATANVALEIGTVAETVEISAGAEVLQTTSATVSSTLVGRQINELPFVSRNVLELLVTQVGTQTVGTPRTSSINGLPKGSMNISLDGLNIQDNLLRSDDGFFTTIQPRTDAIEEVTVSTASVGAESAGEGAAQVKFVTKSGSNNWRGGLFWQHRNTALNANYYFNTINRLDRDQMILNQGGGNLGGPILKNRAFFFVNIEEFRLPQSYNVTATVPTEDAARGIFKWQDGANVRSVNLFELAAGMNPRLPANVRPFPTSPDPTTQGIMNDYIRLATPGTGTLRDRISTNNDYNRNNFNFQTPGSNKRTFTTTRLDFNLTSKHTFNVVHNYQKYYANPDGVNGIYPMLPGTGTVLGHDPVGGTRRISYSMVGALRSTLTPTLTSELRFGVGPAGNSIFREEIAPSLFDQWKGYGLVMGTGPYINNPYRSATSSRRHTPVWTASENVTWARGSHIWNFGGSFTQVRSYVQNVNTNTIPTLRFAIAANDPVNTGATSIFTPTTMPGSTAANRTDAAALFAILGGRIDTFTRTLALQGDGTYANAPSVDRNRQREFALYAQDSWKARPGLTLNFGVRWDVQFPFTALDSSYTRVGYEGVWGVSGVGNIFAPGVLTGSVPQFTQAQAGQAAYDTFWKTFAPSLSFAYVVPRTDAPVLSWLVGSDGKSVIRAGYSIATIREGMQIPISIWGANQGRSVSLTMTPATFPAEFGAPGSVWFRDAAFPTRAAPQRPEYPLQVLPGQSVNDFDPNLKVGYAQSWNFSLQRELSNSMMIDVRYVGNRGTRLWRQVNLNEVNIFENGFLNEFKIAQENLAFARRSNPNSTQFAGLAGQRPIPMITTALGLNSDAAFAVNLERGEAGTMANAIATNTTRMASLTRAGYPENLFRVNPTTGSGGSFLVFNGGDSNYNALQIELKRRMTSGLLVQGSYVFSKSLSNMQASSTSVSSQPTTLRNLRLDRGPSPWDLRHAVKLNFIYELPVGPGKAYFSSQSNRVLSKVLEGWSIAGVSRIQSGASDRLTGRNTVNSTESGVVLHNITQKEFQDMVKIRKTTAANGFGLIYYLPQDFINNSLAAAEQGGFTLAQLDRSKPYVAAQTEAGQFGHRIYNYGPWTQRWDLSAVKKTRIGESKSVELRAQFLNAFNNINFLLGAAGNEINNGGITSTFGQVTDSYRDITVSGTNDPGGRVIEFMLRFNF